MDIRHVKTFKSIIEEGNFSNAAAKLGYTQSTITSQIQQLEQLNYSPTFIVKIH